MFREVNPYFDADFSTWVPYSASSQQRYAPYNRGNRVWFCEKGEEFTFTTGTHLPILNLYISNLGFGSKDLKVSTPETSPIFNLDVPNSPGHGLTYETMSIVRLPELLARDVMAEYKQRRGY